MAAPSRSPTPSSSEAYRANALFDAHRDDPEFGYRFLADEARDAGLAMADRTAWRICRDNGWWSAFGKKRGKDGKRPARRCTTTSSAATSPPTARTGCGSPTSPNTPPAEGKLYLCAVKDVFSNRIVGYSIDSRMKSRLAVAALNNAVARRDDVAGCVLHTDRGSQFRARKLRPRARTVTAWSDRWAGSARQATTPPWSPSSPAAEERPRPPNLGHPRANCGSRS